MPQSRYHIDSVKLNTAVRVLVLGMSVFINGMGAIDCSNPPANFSGDEFPTVDFFSNFQASGILSVCAPYTGWRCPIPRSTVKAG